MTIPALVGKYEIYVRMQQFKKAYSTIQAALEKAQFDLGGNVICNYGTDSGSSDCIMLFDGIALTFKTVKKCDNNALLKECLPQNSYKSGNKVYAENSSNPNKEEEEEIYSNNCPGLNANNFENNTKVYILNDGLIMFPYTVEPITQSPILILDVNGKKGPNKWGYDVFTFYLLKQSKSSSIVLVPQDSTSCHPVEKGRKSAYDYWQLVNKGTGHF